jgi:hypothetical protein
VDFFGAYLFDGMGGLSAPGAALALDHLVVSPLERSGLLKRLANFLTAFNKAKNVKQDHHRAAK